MKNVILERKTAIKIFDSAFCLWQIGFLKGEFHGSIS